MRAATVVGFREPLEVGEVPDPTCGDQDAVIEVQAEGMCRTDWHSWNGEWDWIDEVYGYVDAWRPAPPFIPGHELAGTVVEVGAGVRRFQVGDRVTLPFNEGCGDCYSCSRGDTQICIHMGAAGFTHSGGYGRYTSIPKADLTLVKLPDSVDMVAAASLGCRYATAYRAVIKQGQVRPGQWVAVFGAGGLGLSAVQIASAAGANVIAVDANPAALQLAKSEGAVATLLTHDGVAKEIADISGGGVHVSIGAVGEADALTRSIHSLRFGGLHVQSGLTGRADRGFQAIPIDLLTVREYRIAAAWGCPPSDYPEILSLVESGRLNPRSLVTNEIALEEVTSVFHQMDEYENRGITVITGY